ncbi:MAG: restriction endonuclease subunit S [Propionibacteriaceae bacterium]|nr:restriction endonuclease subunit S [Propionibacteriaceae bacterium]
MSTIDDLIAELCPDGVEYKTLGEVGEFIRGSGLQKSQLTAEGTPAIHYGEVHTHYRIWATETKSFVSSDLASKLRRAKSGDLIIATTSEDDAAVAKATAWIGDEEVAVSGDAYIYHHTLDPKYVAYFFQSTSFQDQKIRHVTGAKVRRISGDSLAKVMIPVPPLEVQREIVRVLDKFTQLEAELEARRRQYEYYRDQLLTFDEAAGGWTSLSETAKRISSGGTPRAGVRDYYEGGEIPWLRTQDINNGVLYGTSAKITEEGMRNSSAKWVPKHCVIVAMYGATAAKVAINEIPLTTNQACCNIEVDSSKAEYRYVFHWVASRYEKLKSLGEGSQSNLNSNKIKNFPIFLPPLEEQRRIVSILDRFDALVNDLNSGLPAEIAARRKQYEHYRDRLLTFEEKR